ncbi:unnamed protein product [Calicophoron daubneyi]|uniref:Nuclear transcription factor Y subunit gamma n=1 Tax=Calicophoron daubneyi TaxID=300641 RepID=A0AAV2TTY6_CALDB
MLSAFKLPNFRKMDYAVDPITDSQAQTLSYWELVRVEIENLKCDHAAFKTQDLPLARIKKIMKLDDDIKCMMISAEAPILFAKAAELFIRELTLRAWIHTERNRRRTLQRNDIAMAVSDGDTDQFDFLIDIVPREEARGHRRAPQLPAATTVVTGAVPHQGTVNLKPESTQQTAGFITTTNGTNNLPHQVVTALPVDTPTASTQPQTVTIALGGSAPTTATGGVTCPQGQQPSIQFATIPSTGVSVAQPSATTGSTVVTTPATNANATAATGAAAAAAAAAAAPIQYVLQLPMGAGGAASGQPFQIQLLPQQFQNFSTDAVSCGQPGTLITDANGNTIPIVQVVSQAGGGLALPVVQDANGTRTQILQLQRPTLLLQQSSGSVLGTTATVGAVLTGVDGQPQQITYSLQPQQILHAGVNANSQPQVLLSFGDPTSGCVTIASEGGGAACIDASAMVVPDAGHLLKGSMESSSVTEAENTETEANQDVSDNIAKSEPPSEADQPTSATEAGQISAGSGTPVVPQIIHFSGNPHVEIHTIDPSIVENGASDSNTEFVDGDSNDVC